jgi:ketosteroid isomerase-like protein
MPEENVEVVRQSFAVLGDAQLEELTDRVLSEFFDPGVEWVPVPQGVLSGNRYLGFEGIRRFVADFVAAWDEFRSEPEEFRESDGRVIAVIRIGGRMHDLEVDEVWSALFTLRDERIVRVEAFATREGALEAAGLRG